MMPIFIPDMRNQIIG